MYIDDCGNNNEVDYDSNSGDYEASYDKTPSSYNPQIDTLAKVRWLMYFCHSTLTAWQQPFIDHSTFANQQVNLSNMQSDLEVDYPISLNDKFELSFGITKHLEPLVFKSGKLDKDKLGRLLTNLSDEDRMCRFIHHYLRIDYIDSLVNKVELQWD